MVGLIRMRTLGETLFDTPILKDNVSDYVLVRLLSSLELPLLLRGKIREDQLR